MNSSNPDYLLKAPPPNTITLGSKGFNVGIWGGGGHNSVHSTLCLGDKIFTGRIGWPDSTPGLTLTHHKFAEPRYKQGTVLGTEVTAEDKTDKDSAFKGGR